MLSWVSSCGRYSDSRTNRNPVFPEKHSVMIFMNLIEGIKMGSPPWMLRWLDAPWTYTGTLASRAGQVYRPKPRGDYSYPPVTIVTVLVHIRRWGWVLGVTAGRHSGRFLSLQLSGTGPSPKPYPLLYRTPPNSTPYYVVIL